MFDLDAQIRAWRQACPAALSNQQDVLDELEAHLREDFDRGVRAGGPPEQAWAAAVERLGPPGPLAGEFAKLSRTAWLPARLAWATLAAAGVLAACLLGSRLWHGRVSPLLAAHVLAVTLGYGATFAVGLLAAWSVIGRAARGRGPARSEAFRGAAVRLAAVGLVLTAVGVALGAVWSHAHLGRYWGWDAREVGGLCVLLWNGLTWWAVRRSSASPGGLSAAVAGNIVVSLAWFGPPLVEAGRQQGPPYAPYLVAFVVAQVLLIGLALATARPSERRPAGTL